MTRRLEQTVKSRPPSSQRTRAVSRTGAIQTRGGQERGRLVRELGTCQIRADEASALLTDRSNRTVKNLNLIEEVRVKQHDGEITAMSVLEGIEAVTFDVGGTLIHPWPSVGHIYSESAARHGYPDISTNILNQQFAAAWRAKKNFDHSRRAWLDLVEKTFSRLVDESVIGEFFDDIYEHFAKGQAWRVFDDVEPALNR